MTTKKFLHCLRKVYGGDGNGLRPIYEEYYRKLKITANYILHNEQLAQDAVHDVMVKLLEYAQTHKRPNIENAGAYLNTAIRNRAKDIYNANKGTVDIDTVAQLCVDGEHNAMDRAVIWQAFKALSEPDFRIATMFYFYDYKTEEIANELNMPIGTVFWKLNGIRKELKKYF